MPKWRKSRDYFQNIDKINYERPYFNTSTGVLYLCMCTACWF